MAGLHSLRIMPEPTVVALLYTKQQQEFVPLNVFDGSEKNALIFNMGAGFCDVAAIATAGGVSMTKAMTGAAIGCEDILQNLMQHLLPNAEALFSRHGVDGIRMMESPRVAAQNAILELSSETSSLVDVDLGNWTHISKTITREECEGVNLQVFEKSENLIIQCLQESQVDPEDLAEVVLVGGCSKIPKTINLVKELCGKEELYQGIDPAVCGAARGRKSQ